MISELEGLTGSARLVFWNVERLRHLDAIAGHLQDHTPDVILLSEVDRGMARTGNTDRIAMLYQGKLIWIGDAKSVDASDNEYVDQFVHGRAEGPIKMQVRR